MCANEAAGTASPAELAELLRLTRGDIIAGARRQRAFSPSGSLASHEEKEDACDSLASAYRGLWRALADDQDALRALWERYENAVPRQWPPTFAQVQQMYNYVDTSLDSLEELDTIDMRALAQSNAISPELVRLLGNAVRQHWVPWAHLTSESGHVDKHAGDHAPSECDPDNEYFVLQGGTAEEGVSYVMLLAYNKDGSMSDIDHVEAITEYRPEMDINEGLQVTIARQSDGRIKFDTNAFDLSLEAGIKTPGAIDENVFTAFLAALPINETVAGTLLDPAPIGVAQMRAAMAPIDDVRELPQQVLDYFDESYGRGAQQFFRKPVRGAWIGECQLVAAAKMFEGQLIARAHDRERPQPPSLLLASAAAYGPNPPPPGVLPFGIEPSLFQKGAAYAWRSTCAAPVDPITGHLPNRQRLLRLAQESGLQVTDMERDMPELLCARLGNIYYGTRGNPMTRTLVEPP